MKFEKISTGSALLACVLSAHAVLPTGGAYITDPQSSYVQDMTSQGTDQASAILCYMANTRPDAMVNKGTYIAFIDESKCDSNKADASNSSSEGGGSSSTYTRMRLNSTRASNTSAQVVKGHAAVNMMNGTMPAYVYIKASGTEAPSAAAPNGVVTMHMGALKVSDNTRLMRGKIDATASGFQFSMNNLGGSNYRLYVNGNETSGVGAISYPYNSNTYSFTFGYNASKFCRNDGTTTSCFDRSGDLAAKSVWRYGVYDDTTGARYDIPVPPFPVRNTTSGEYGYASYWGIWFPTPVAGGETVQTLSAAPTNYTVLKTGGRLTKITLVSANLNDVAKVPFNFFPQTTTSVTGGTLQQHTSYDAYWDNTNNNFAVTGQFNCGASGCFKQNLTGVTATAAEMNAATTRSGVASGINGWSQGLGGNLRIPSATLLAGTPGTAAVKYNTQSVVMPGDTSVPATLKCARDCPSFNLLNTPTTISQGYTTGTLYKGGGTAAVDVVTYTWNSTNYTLSDGAGSITNSLLAGKTLPQSNPWGFRSGALVDATGSKWAANGSMDCGINGTSFCDYKANNETTYYVWENGTSDYQSAKFLKKVSDNSIVAFTPPVSAAFDVPNDLVKYGTFAGAKLNLQFLGFGDLGGIPGRCFSPDTNLPANCDSTTRYVPAFSIPENSATDTNDQNGRLTINSVTKWVKYLDREIRFKKIATDNSIVLGNLANLPTAMVLTGDAEDPSVISSGNYAGAISASDFLAAPSVIHGVVQP